MSRPSLFSQLLGGFFGGLLGVAVCLALLALVELAGCPVGVP